MLRLIARRLLYIIPVLFIVTLVTFFMQDMLPGDPAVFILGTTATPEQIENLHTELGLDQPVTERYVDWLSHAVRGDFGNSLLPPIQDVGDMIRTSLPVTLELAVVAMVMSLALSVPVALYSAYRAGHRFDRSASSVAFALISIPSFVMALLLALLLVFYPNVARWAAAIAGALITIWLLTRMFRVACRDDVEESKRRAVLLAGGAALAAAVATIVLASFWPSFPRQGFSRLVGGDGLRENLRHVFLPALTLALAEFAVFMRLLRNDLITTLQEDYINFARAKGMPPRRILVYDALRPSAFSLITVAGVAFGRLIGGTVIVETIFNLPGMGSMIVKAVGSGDFRVVQAGVLVIAVFYVLINTFVDITYLYLDPRMRRG